MHSVARPILVPLPGKNPSQTGFFTSVKAKFTLSDDQKERIEEEFTFYGEVLSEVFNLGSHFYSAYRAGVSFPSKVNNTIKLIEQAFEKFLLDHPNVDQAIKGCQVFSVVSIPGALYRSGNGVRDFCKGDLSKRIDSVLDILYEVGTIGTSVSEVALGLQAIGKITEKSIWWATPLGIISTGLCITKPFKTGYQWWQNRQFLIHFSRNSGLDKQGDYAIQDFENAITFLKTKNDEFLETHCGEDGTKLTTRIEKISQVAKQKLSTGNLQEAKEARKQLKDTMEDLRKRISSENRSLRVSLVSNIVEFAGYCLFFVSPLAPVGEGLVTASSVIEDGDKWYQDRLFLHEFKIISGMGKKNQPSINDLEKAIEFIKAKDDASLKKHFNVKAEKLKQAAHKVSTLAKAKLASGNLVKIKEGEKELKDFVELLKRRVENGQLSQQLSVLSGSVSIVGLGVLFAPPVVPLGYGLLIAGSGIAIGKHIFTKIIESRFEKNIEILAEKDKPAKPQETFASVVDELKKTKSKSISSKRRRRVFNQVAV